MHQVSRKKSFTVERISSFDFFKCVGILGFLYVHSIVYDWRPVTGKEEKLFYPESEEQMSAGMRILVYFITMGGSFFFFSSACRFYLLIKRLSVGYDLRQLIYADIVYSLFLFVIHFLFIGVVSNRGIARQFLVEREEIEWKEVIKGLIHQSSVLLMSQCILLMKLIYLVIFSAVKRRSSVRKDEVECGRYRRHVSFPDVSVLNRAKFILVVSGFTIIILTPFIRMFLLDIFDRLIEKERWVLSFLIHSLVGNTFSIFPFLSIFCFGAFFGCSLHTFEQSKDLFSFLVTQTLFSAVLIVVGFCGLYVHFGSHFVYSGLMVEYTKRGMLFRSFLQCSQIGMMMILITLGYFLFDHLGRLNRSFFPMRGSIINFSLVVSKVGLTVYFFEYMFKMLLSVPFRMLFPGYSESYSQCVLFSVCNIFLWTSIAILMRRFWYIGSVEYVIFKTVYLLTGKESTKIMV